MIRGKILVLFVVQWASIAFVNYGCRRNSGDGWVTTPMYSDLSANDIAECQRKALLSGDEKAAYRLYLHYELGFSPNKTLAFYWLNKAGELGHEDAREGIASDQLKYLNDNHVTLPVYSDRSLRDIAKCQRKTLLSKDGEAAYRLYLHYRVGCMVDSARAAFWLHKAGEAGYERAVNELNLSEITLTNRPFDVRR